MRQPTLLLGVVALYGMLLGSLVDAVVPTCPALAVAAKARPRASRKPGSTFAVYAKVRNTGRTSLQNVSLVVNAPLSATYKGATTAAPMLKHLGANKAGPVVVGQYAYWPNFSLAPGKGLAFKLRGKVDKCEQTGTYDVQVAAYMTSLACSTPVGTPLKVINNLTWKIAYAHTNIHFLLLLLSSSTIPGKSGASFHKAPGSPVPHPGADVGTDRGGLPGAAGPGIAAGLLWASPGGHRLPPASVGPPGRVFPDMLL